MLQCFRQRLPSARNGLVIHVVIVPSSDFQNRRFPYFCASNMEMGITPCNPPEPRPVTTRRRMRLTCGAFGPCDACDACASSSGSAGSSSFGGTTWNGTSASFGRETSGACPFENVVTCHDVSLRRDALSQSYCPQGSGSAVQKLAMPTGRKPQQNPQKVELSSHHS